MAHQSFCCKLTVFKGKCDNLICKVFFVCFGAFLDFPYPLGVEGKNLRQFCLRAAYFGGLDVPISSPDPPSLSHSSPGPMICPICEPTEHDVIDVIGMGTCGRASPVGISCVSTSPRSRRWVQSLCPSTTTSSHNYVLDPLGENIYNQAEGNSGDEEMDDENKEAIYCNVTPASRAFGAGAAEEYRPRHGPGPNVGAMAVVWNLVAILRLLGETARYNI